MKVVLPSFIDGDMVTLAQLLALVDGADWRWALSEFEGSSHIGSDLDVRDLQRDASATPEGISYDWPDLLRLADAIDQAIWAKLTAFLDEDGSERPVFDIEFFDSTDVTVWADDADPKAVAAVISIRELNPRP